MSRSPVTAPWDRPSVRVALVEPAGRRLGKVSSVRGSVRELLADHLATGAGADRLMTIVGAAVRSGDIVTLAEAMPLPLARSRR